LIVIGLLKKLRPKIELDGSLPTNLQVDILFEEADNFFSKDRYSDSIEVLNKAIVLDNFNFECIKLRGIANYEIRNFEKAKIDFETPIKNEKYISTAYYYLGNLAIVHKDRKLVHSYWLKAKELNNENAKIKLDLLGNYILSYSQIEKKVGSGHKKNDSIYGGSIYAKYNGGLHQIDQTKKQSSLDAEIRLFYNGILIELNVDYKKKHLGIAYYEIDNIAISKPHKKLELHLSDKNILTFSFNDNFNYHGFKKLCEYFKLATDITPDAANPKE